MLIKLIKGYELEYLQRKDIKLVGLPEKITLPNSKKAQNFKFIFVTGYYEEGKYIILSSRTITKEELKKAIENKNILATFTYSIDNTILHSTESWNKALYVKYQNWKQGLEIMESVEKRITILSKK